MIVVRTRIPAEVTKLQLVRALRGRGLWDQVRTIIGQASADVQEDWQLAVSIARTDPLIASFADALGLSEDERDRIFVEAASS